MPVEELAKEVDRSPFRIGEILPYRLRWEALAQEALFEGPARLRALLLADPGLTPEAVSLLTLDENEEIREGAKRHPAPWVDYLGERDDPGEGRKGKGRAQKSGPHKGVGVAMLTLTRELREGIRRVLEKHGPKYGAKGVKVSLEEEEFLLWVGFTLDFGGSILPGAIAISRFPDPQGAYPVLLYLFPRLQPKGVPPWVTLEKEEEGYSLRVGQLAKRGEILEAVERLYLHMAYLGEILEPEGLKELKA